MKSIFLAFAVIVFFSVPANSQSEYVGYEYKGVVPDTTLPNGVKHLGGGLIGDIQADPVYGISLVEKSGTKMLWLKVSTGQDSTGVTGWKVLDVLSFPAMAKSDYLFFTDDPSLECRRSGNEIPNLVGTARIFRSRGIAKPLRLWAANLKTKKFESMPTVGVKCVSDEP